MDETIKTISMTHENYAGGPGTLRVHRYIDTGQAREILFRARLRTRRARAAAAAAAALVEASYISNRAKAQPNDVNFSAAIRQDLPGFEPGSRRLRNEGFRQAFLPCVI